MNNEAFWLALEALVNECEIIVDRPKGTPHPLYRDYIYPIDYGYLKGTKAMDGYELDIWIGTAEPKTIDAIVTTVDLNKKDAEIKILYGCTSTEKQVIYNILNQAMMRCILIDRY